MDASVGPDPKRGGSAQGDSRNPDASGRAPAGSPARGGPVSPPLSAGAGNFPSGGYVAAPPNAPAGNFPSGGYVAAPPNAPAGNFPSGGYVAAPPNAPAGNFPSGGYVAAPPSAPAGNFPSGGYVAAPPNAPAGEAPRGDPGAAPPSPAARVGDLSAPRSAPDPAAPPRSPPAQASGELSEDTLRTVAAWTGTYGLDQREFEPGHTFRPAAGDVDAPTSARIELLETLGEGGMGVVYRARQHKLKREVAVKTIRPDQRADETRKAFLAESLVTARLQHPGIVAIHDLVRDGEGALQLVMPVVRGQSWRALLRPKTAADHDRARELGADFHYRTLIDVCHSIEYAHDQGVYHLDLKPSNIMVGEYGEVVVMDWGIALTQEQLARGGVVGPRGTPSYMSPELADGDLDRIGPWTDVYLLGGILHEILTGHPPHRGGSYMQLIVHACRSAPPTLEADTPLELRRLITRALAREPAQRYATVAEFREALEAFLQHRDSLKLSQRARRRLVTCESIETASLCVEARAEITGELAESIAGFRQALELWPENREALEGRHKATLEAARFALEGGDLSLVRASLDAISAVEDPVVRAEADRLLARCATAEAARDRSARNLKLFAVSLAVAGALIMTGLTIGLYVVNGYRREAEDSARRAERQRVAAEQARRAESEQRLKATAAAEAQRRLAVEADTQRKAAVENLADALAERARLALERRDGSFASVLLARALALGDRPEIRSLAASARNLDPGVVALAGLELDLPCDSASIDPEGRRLAVLGKRGLHFVDLESGRLIRRVDMGGKRVVLAWRPDGSKLLVLRKGERRIEELDPARDRAITHRIPSKGALVSLDVAPDRPQVVFGSSRNEVILYDLVQRRVLARAEARSGQPSVEAVGPVTFVAFDPPGRVVNALGVRKGSSVFDARSLRPLTKGPLRLPPPCRAAAFFGASLLTRDIVSARWLVFPLSPQGTRSFLPQSLSLSGLSRVISPELFATAAPDDSLSLWDIRTLDHKARLRVGPGRPIDVRLSAARGLLTVVTDRGFVRRFELRDPLKALRLADQFFTRHVAAGPDGLILCASERIGGGRKPGAIALYSVPRRQVVSMLRVPGNPGRLSVSPDGKWVTGRGGVKGSELFLSSLARPDPAIAIDSSAGRIQALTWQPDSAGFAAILKPPGEAGRKLAFYGLDGKLRRTLAPTLSGRFGSLVFTDSGRAVLLAGHGQIARLDLDSPKPRPELVAEGYEPGTLRARPGRDDFIMVGASSIALVKPDGAVSRSIAFPSGIQNGCVSPDGRYFLGLSKQHGSRVLDLESGRMVYQLPQELARKIRSAAFSTDGTTIFLPDGPRLLELQLRRAFDSHSLPREALRDLLKRESGLELNGLTPAIRDELAPKLKPAGS